MKAALQTGVAFSASRPSPAAPERRGSTRLAEIDAILQCPHCGAGLSVSAVGAAFYVCQDAACPYHAEGFPMVAGTPALIDFATSVIDRSSLEDRSGASAIDRSGVAGKLLRGAVYGENPIAARNCGDFLAAVRAASPTPRVLVIGGGERGAGTAALYAAADVAVVGTDIYASEAVDVIADAHRLPFQDGVFDGVWIQAVLEHVLDPAAVVADIHRVLAPAGVVYAETPFMQQVHEGAYDFTRFSRSGHRWLFRCFEEIGSGTVGGPGQSLIWAIRYLVRALTGSNKGATLLAAPFFWLRYLDSLCRQHLAADAANGVYFLGRRSAVALAPQDIIAYYARAK